MFTYRCPECHQKLHASEHLVGLTISCPECKERIVVPAGDGWTGVPAQHDELARPRTRPAATAVADQTVDWLLKGAPADRVPRGVRVAPPSGPSKVLVVSLCAAMFVAVVVLSWFLAGTTVLDVVLKIAAVLAGLVCFSVVVAALKGQLSWGFRSFDGAAVGFLLLLFLYVGATIATGFAIHLLFPRAPIYVDNLVGPGVRLELDGQPWVEVADQSSRKTSLRKGKYVVVIYSAATNQELDRMEINVTDRGPFVLNVLGAQTYAFGRAEYGTLAFGSPPAEVAKKDKWFKADVDYLFEEPPSSISVSTKRGQSPGVVSKTYVRKGEPKPLPQVTR
jgi:DNA-directed RNA polymerase subunit RPC12/RpoP